MNGSNIITKCCNICRKEMLITYEIYRNLISKGQRLYCKDCMNNINYTTEYYSERE